MLTMLWFLCITFSVPFFFGLSFIFPAKMSIRISYFIRGIHYTTDRDQSILANDVKRTEGRVDNKILFVIIIQVVDQRREGIPLVVVARSPKDHDD
jgi:hypothetical protein